MIKLGCILQVYPTTVRSLALGSCSAIARIGAMITPFIAQVRQTTLHKYYNNINADMAVLGCTIEYDIKS